MTLVSEPLWRVKTRPCEFHQQGRCFFGDTCNFLHVDAAWSPQESTLVEKTPSKEVSNNSIRSPTRSPRFSDLLHVLKDVIGEEQDSDLPLEAIDDRSTDISLLSPMSLSGLQLTTLKPYDSKQRFSPTSSYYESWTTPGPLVLSPPRSPAMQSTFDILSSPFGSPTSRLMSLLPRVSPRGSSLSSCSNEEEAQLDLSLDSPPPPQVDEETTAREPTRSIGTPDPQPSDNEGFTSRWDAGDNPTMVYMPSVSEQEVAEAILHSKTSPAYYLASDTFDFDEEEVNASSSFIVEDDSQEEQCDDSYEEEEPEDESFTDSFEQEQLDETARLAYAEDDTLSSLYDVYSADEDEVGSSIDEPSQSPSPQEIEAVPLRQRVFTPPPDSNFTPRKFADSPTSLASGSTPLDSPSSSHRRSLTSQAARSPRPVLTLATDLEEKKELLDLKASPQAIQSSPAYMQRHSVRVSPSKTVVGKGLKPLRLSTILSHEAGFSLSPLRDRFPRSISRASLASTNVSSAFSLSDNPLLSSPRSASHIPEPNTHTFSHNGSPNLEHRQFTTSESPQSAPAVQTAWAKSPPTKRLSRIPHLESENPDDGLDETIRRPVTSPFSAPSSSHSITTPRPTLLFAIASDDTAQVLKVLESGEAGPNDSVGPQSALAFTLTNEQLVNKLGIVKALLAHGADPGHLKSSLTRSGDSPQTYSAVMSQVDVATRYYIARAEAPLTRRISVLMHRSLYRPLTRLRYEMIGQDRALEQLFRVLSIQSQAPSIAPLVMLLCGPSGLGKSLLSHRFGPLLNIPSHVVNMTTLRSAQDLWQSYSMTAEDSPRCTLLEFLVNNEGQRCVVVLDEIEKTEDPKALWSLLVPWELGRCSFEANSLNIDVRKVIWMCTSNIGHEIVHQSCASRSQASLSRGEYVELMGSVRKEISGQLGESLVSRLTTILPFVEFTRDEISALATEALYSLSTRELMRSRTPQELAQIVDEALVIVGSTADARSLYRAVTNQLVEAVDLDDS